MSDCNSNDIKGSKNTTRAELELQSAFKLCLAIQDHPITRDQLFGLVPGRKQNKVTAFNLIQRDSEVLISGTGRRGNPFLISLANPLKRPPKELPQKSSENPKTKQEFNYEDWNAVISLFSELAKIRDAKSS